MTGQSLESWVLRRNDADGLEAVEVRRTVAECTCPPRTSRRRKQPY